MSLMLTPFIRSACLLSTISLLIVTHSATAQTAASSNTQLPEPPPDVIVPTDAGTTANTAPTNPGILGTGDATLNSVRFVCRLENGLPTVMYQPESQPDQSYAWAVPQAMGGNWSAERRCQEISQRLELYRPDGLVEMQTAVENGYNTVCVTTDNVPSCRIVFTVPPGQDPITTRDSVFQNLAIADSGQQTAGVFTLRANSSSQILDQLGKALNINLGGLLGQQSGSRIRSKPMPDRIYLKPFLDQADGGTGTSLNQLPRRRSKSSNQPLRLRDVLR